MARSFPVMLFVLLSACGAKPAPDVRDTRYCEILVGFQSGPDLHVDVYNTQGLNDCPASAWSLVNANQVQTAFSADVVLLNGPRYWMIDSFGDSSLLNGTPTNVGGIEMRQAGAIDVSLGDISALEQPYGLHTIQRNTSFIYSPGKTVYELLNGGHVYTMQSYSVEKEPQQTIDSLSNLGSQLTLPAGWTFRTRVLTSELDIRSANETATVVQDNFDNTYLQSQ